MDRIICQSVLLNCTSEVAFDLFTNNRFLERWLSPHANVVPEAGGKFELYWDSKDKENNSTIGCKILAMEHPHFLVFEWKGAKPFKHFMNHVRPLTNVSVFFVPKGKHTQVSLVHTGWRESVQWEGARQFYADAWRSAFAELEGLVRRLAALKS